MSALWAWTVLAAVVATSVIVVEEIRAELYRALQANPLRDGREWVQVPEILSNGLVKLWALMSAADSASIWDLRCDVREHLIAYIRDHHPEALPRFRVGAGPTADGAVPARAGTAPPDGTAAGGGHTAGGPAAGDGAVLPDEDPARVRRA